MKTLESHLYFKTNFMFMTNSLFIKYSDLFRVDSNQNGKINHSELQQALSNGKFHKFIIIKPVGCSFSRYFRHL